MNEKDDLFSNKRKTVLELWNFLCEKTLQHLDCSSLKEVPIGKEDRDCLAAFMGVTPDTLIHENITQENEEFVKGVNMYCKKFIHHPLSKILPQPVYLILGKNFLDVEWGHLLSIPEQNAWKDLSLGERGRFMQKFYQLTDLRNLEFYVDFAQAYVISIGNYIGPNQWGFSFNTIFNQLRRIGSLGHYVIMKLLSTLKLIEWKQ